MAKKEKTEKPVKQKKQRLTEKEKELIRLTPAEKRQKRKEIIVNTIVTIVLLAVLLGGSTALGLYLFNDINQEEIYSYSTTVKYLTKAEIAHTAEENIADDPDGIVAKITVGDMQILYFGESLQAQNYRDSYRITEHDKYYNIKCEFNADLHEDIEDARNYCIIGIEGASYAEVFGEIFTD